MEDGGPVGLPWEARGRLGIAYLFSQLAMVIQGWKLKGAVTTAGAS